MSDPSPAGGTMAPPSASGLQRRQLFREFFLALRRGLTLGPCRSCETFSMMAKLCLREDAGWLTADERKDVASWADAGGLIDDGAGCEDACAVITRYARLSR